MTGEKKAKLLIITVVGLILLSAFWTGRKSYSPSNVIAEESVSCISAVCVTDDALGECREFPPRVARVVQTTDINTGAVRLVISLKNTCKGN